MFDSKYRGGDKVWHDTKYNRRFMINGMVGKEWMLGVNLKATVLGGQRYTPVNATGQKDYLGHKYNLKSGVIEPRMSKTSMFNVSYKIEF